MESGITEATISPARRFPKKKTSTKITINAPSIRFVLTVPMARFTILVRSKKVSTMMPSGRDFLIWSIRTLMASMTAEAFSPFSIRTTAPATSPLSSYVMAPYLTAEPILTSAMSRISTGMPEAVDLTGIFRISSRLPASPSERMNSSEGPFSMYAPPEFWLFASRALNTSVTVMPRLLSLAG